MTMSNAGEKILVTGAGGCIGAWVLWQLHDAGVTPVAFDLSDNRARAALLRDNAAEADALLWETGDIGDAAQVAAVVDKHQPAAIIHLAALQVPFCKADPVNGARVNVVGSVNVFEAAKRAGIRRIAYASSVAATAMDSGGNGSGRWLKTLYGAYKVCNEQTARVYWQDDGIASTGIRPSVVYGAARDQGMSALPTVAMLAACAGAPYNVPFRGSVGFVYAAEAAAAFVQAVADEREGAEVFDLNGSALTVEEVLEQIRQRVPQAQLTCSGEALPFPSDMSDEPLRRHIGDYRRHEFSEGLDETLAIFTRRLREQRLSADFISGSAQGNAQGSA